MYGANDLKPVIKVSPDHVECPVLHCDKQVKRQRGSFKAESQYQCSEHKIYISPSTFEYPDKLDNLLWKDREDLELLEAILRVKRECRMSRDNSEDAVTWNVFRYLEKTQQLEACLSARCGCSVAHNEIIYWSHSQRERGVWPPLAEARKMFGEHPKRSSEPDLFVLTDKVLFLIEAKLTATNVTDPGNPAAYKNYLTGGGGWFGQVFQSAYQTVAIQARKYELMRFWLLGSWIAHNLGRDFYLVNLVRSAKELDIEHEFSLHVITGDHRTFRRLTWEDLFNYVATYGPDTQENRQLRDYFVNKIIGYNRWGHLEHVFAYG